MKNHKAKKKNDNEDGVLNTKEFKASRNHYRCLECETNYYTSEDQAPPSPRWADGHKCEMVLIRKKDE